MNNSDTYDIEKDDKTMLGEKMNNLNNDDNYNNNDEDEYSSEINIDTKTIFKSLGKNNDYYISYLRSLEVCQIFHIIENEILSRVKRLTETNCANKYHILWLVHTLVKIPKIKEIITFDNFNNYKIPDEITSWIKTVESIELLKIFTDIVVVIRNDALECIMSVKSKSDNNENLKFLFDKKNYLNNIVKTAKNCVYELHGFNIKINELHY